MGIPEDYYRATGETMGQACRRLAPTETITSVALAIGYDSAGKLRKALADRGIPNPWADAPTVVRTLHGEPSKRIQPDGTTEKRCTACKAWKPLDSQNFQPIKARATYHGKCRDCINAHLRASRAA